MSQPILQKDIAHNHEVFTSEHLTKEKRFFDYAAMSCCIHQLYDYNVSLNPCMLAYRLFINLA